MSLPSFFALMRAMRYRMDAPPPFMHSRNRYYMRHPGLRPMSSVDRPLPDNYGLALLTDPVQNELTITDIDLNIYKNTKKHFCDRYDITSKLDVDKKAQIPKLVVRRGFPFEVTLRLNRPYYKDKDNIAIQLAFGDRPKIPKNTLVRVPIESGRKGNEWTVDLKSVNTNELSLEINSSAKCFVGVWRLSGHITFKNSKTKVTQFKEIYVIFNPFNKEDDVYMNDPKEREEYVMNDHGMLFIGTCETYNSRPWSFSQFYGHILECTMYLLEESDLPYTDRGRPVLVCRRLAALINSADDNGVLMGRWDGNYKKGTAPTKWVGSSKILDQYWKTKETVMYGQCWVFSGILITVCRAIGIPCRSVTNYCSAHDTDSSVSIDHFYNENHEYEEYMNEDTVWNFHVWNEVFMTRPDLPDESYSGWQALDATPQETSDGVYCCGPCPVAAIKKGDVNAQYDAPFVIAEVNADIYMWIKQKNGRYKLSRILTNRVGTRLLTKKIDRMESLDITLEYKYPEGSRDERAIMKRIVLSSSRGSEILKKEVDDVKVEVIVDKDTMIGSDFPTKLLLKNTSTEIRTLYGNVNIKTTYYTGVVVKELFNQRIKLVLQPNGFVIFYKDGIYYDILQAETVAAVMRYADYAPSLQEHNNINFQCVIEVDENGQIININKVYRLKLPDLKITAPLTVKRHALLTVTVAFTNPLPVPLTSCVLNVEETGFSKYSPTSQKFFNVTIIRRKIFCMQRNKCFWLLLITIDPVADELIITDIDLNIYKNTKTHFCNRYDITLNLDLDKKPQIPKLVIRRGFSFEITLRLSQPYKKGKDKVSIQLAFGKRPKIPKETLIRLPIESGGTSKKWAVKLKATNANEITVDLTSPPDCFVGVWRLSGFVTYSNKSTNITKHKEIYIIFNPFHKDDGVYMSDQKEREEYLMNEQGLLYIGTCETFKSRSWDYSQFYGHVLECTMYLLEKSDLPYTDRGKPVLVCRRLAAMVNSADDDGVIEGKWDGEYTSGVPPSDWPGSARILEKYWKTKQPVLYGQCWVFSGLLVTVCRAIGIPCRSVTNYCSAHDTDSSVTVDHFFNEKHEYEEDMNDDSIWNFHVWNEVYMTRPDLLDEDYNGWQALDSTPQETSDGIYCCGPCPVAAIKKGDVKATYDAPFIIAEVNADLIMWLKQKNGHYKFAALATDEIGKRILTKQVKKMEEQEITLDYKFAEGSKEERAASKRAVISGSRAKDIIMNKAEDVQIEFIADKDTMIGTDFSTKFIFNNTANETRTLNGNICIMTTYYTGVIAHILYKQPLKFLLKKHAKENAGNVLRYTEYSSKLKDHCSVNIRYVFEVEETNQILSLNKVYRFKKPDLKINAPVHGKLNVLLTFNVSFKNPLPVQLSKCVLYVDGSGLTQHLTLQQKNVEIGKTFSAAVSVKPWTPGTLTLVCTFSCEQIQGIDGQHTIEIEKS